LKRLLLIAALACKPAAPAQYKASPEGERCYTEAKLKAQTTIDAQCPGRFTTCETAGVILEQLRRDQEACPE
jgi:hypothetical protein